MERVQGTIEIAAPPAEVMRALADFPSYPAWSGFQQCEVRATGPDGRATEVHVVLAMGPVTATYTIAIEYLDADAGLRWRFVEGSGITNTEGEYRLEAGGAGTVVHYSGAADANLPVPGFVKRKLIAEGQKIGRDKALKGLKAFVETGR